MGSCLGKIIHVHAWFKNKETSEGSFFKTVRGGRKNRIRFLLPVVDNKMRIKRVKKKVKTDLKLAKSKYVIDTAPHDPKLPGLFVFCGSRGSGKTHSCVAMVKHFEKMGYINRTFLICPTKQSNDIFSNLKTLNHKKDVCDDVVKCQSSLANILKEIKKDWQKYEEDLEYLKIFVHWFNGPRATVPYKHQMILESRNFEQPTKPVRPSHMLICDDCQGTNMYSNARSDMMNHIAIKSRHIPITVAFLVQSWHGLPRVIRLNATQFIIFKTGDKKQLHQIYEHFGTTLDEETFNRVYEYAVSKPHGFLYIDTEPKEESMRFRSGFNDLIDVSK